MTLVFLCCSTAMFDHQYIGTVSLLSLTIVTLTNKNFDSLGKYASTQKATFLILSHSYIRRTGVLSSKTPFAVNSFDTVKGEWSVTAIFHSTPPENHASLKARFAGCN